MKSPLTLAALVLAASLPALAEPVAQVAETKGAVTVQRPDGRWRLISSRSNVEAGDTVVTEANSTAVVAFTDGSKVALRPNTRFQITEYRHLPAEPDKDNALFKLITGGLRTITGLIGKRGNQDAYRMQSPTATIGIPAAAVIGVPRTAIDRVVQAVEPPSSTMFTVTRKLPGCGSACSMPVRCGPSKRKRVNSSP